MKVLSEKAGINQMGNSFNLSDSLVVKTNPMDFDSANVATMEETYKTRESLDNFNLAEVRLNEQEIALAAGRTLLPEIEAMTTRYVLLVLQMPTTVGNEANHNGTDIPEIQLGLNVLATQQVYESDAFGNDYDADAKFAVTDAGELADMLTNGDKAVLGVDIEADKEVEIPANTEAELDLNGKTLSAKHHKNDGNVLENNGDLTITGGTIASTGENGGSAIRNNGTLTVDGATLNGAPNADGSWPSYTINNTGVMTVSNSNLTSVHGAVASYGEGAVLTLNNCTLDMTGISGFTSHGIYTYNGGKVIINGGTYINNAADQNSTGGSVINGNVEINSGVFKGRIESYYGTPVIKGGTFTVDPSKYVPKEGYTVTKDEANSTWTVTAN